MNAHNVSQRAARSVTESRRFRDLNLPLRILVVLSVGVAALAQNKIIDIQDHAPIQMVQ